MKFPQAHELAMEAKFKIFKAQDAADDITDQRLREVVGDKLAKIRSELEDLDNQVRAVMVGRSKVDDMLAAVRRLDPSATKGLYSVYVRSPKGRLTLSWTDSDGWRWSWLSQDHVDRVGGALESVDELPEILELCR